MSVLDTAKARFSVRAYTEQAVPESASIYIEGNQTNAMENLQLYSCLHLCII